MRVTLIHNEEAGADDRPDGLALQKLVREAGHAVLYQPCSDTNWAAILDEPADLIAVAGGDGTVGRVAKKLIGRNVPLAPLPFGTANNISRTLGLTGLTPEQIISGWNARNSVRFDVGVAKGPWGTRYFVEGMGVGLFAGVLPDANENATLAALPDADAKVRHALRMLRERLARCCSHELRIVIDSQDFSGEYVLFEAMNMEFVGPNLYLAPDVTPDDGLLDVVLVTKSECNQLRATLEDWHDGELAHPHLTRVRGSRIELEWSGFDVHFDDEAWPDKEEAPPAPRPIELTLERNALTFLAPPQA